MEYRTSDDVREYTTDFSASKRHFEMSGIGSVPSGPHTMTYWTTSSLRANSESFSSASLAPSGL